MTSSPTARLARSISGLTRDFKDTVLARVQTDPKFRNAFLEKGIETMLAGDVETGKAILRDYIEATVDFEQLGAKTGSSPKSLIRMFGPTGNLRARPVQRHQLPATPCGPDPARGIRVVAHGPLCGRVRSVVAR